MVRYYHMTGENHVSYNAGLKRYLMGNYGLIDPEGNPRPYLNRVDPAYPPNSISAIWRSVISTLMYRPLIAPRIAGYFRMPPAIPTDRSTLCN